MRRWVAMVAAVVAGLLSVAACRPITPTTAGTHAEAASTAVYAWQYPVVWVEDHTGRRWPVTTAVRQWDAGTTVSVRYGPCRPGAGCIRVYEADWGDNGDGGVTNLKTVGSTVTSATSRLNNYYLDNGPIAALVTACHEIGHGLGLPHSASRGSCLYPIADEGATKPDAHDRALLNRHQTT